MRQEVPIVGGFGKDVDLHLSAQDTLNWLPIPAESPGSRSQFMLRQAPGLRPLTQIGTGPVRGVHTAEGRLYVVSGTQLYEVSNTYVGIPRGVIPGVGRVSMAHNQRGTGNELAVDNGAARYVLNTATLEFQKVTDAGFPGSFIAFYVDQYLGYVEPQGRYWGHSDLADALAYNTLDQYEAEGDPDRIVSAFVSHREVLIFGKETTEPFVNTGGATGTFERASNTVIENGCAARFGVAGMDNSVFWPDDKRIIRRLDGYSAIRISTAAEEAMLAECTDSEIKRAYAFTWEDRGHKVYYLTVPGKFTLGYDLLSGQFHRRSSPGMNTWRINSLAYWNGMWVGGDMQDGSLYALDWDYFYDAQEELVRERVTGALSNNQARLLVSEIELLFGTGGPSSAPAEPVIQPTGPTITGNAPNGTVGAAYSYAYSVSGGTAPLVVTLAPGSDPLPPGLTLSTAGVLSGTPTTLGSSSFVVRVTDENDLWDDQPDTVAIQVISGIWFFGPVVEDGAMGGSDLFYLKAYTPDALTSAEPTPLPVEGDGGITHLSVANGAVFMARGVLGCVSFDSGATWDECSIPLDGVLDTFWDGAYYFNGTNRSADGITWAAMPSIVHSTAKVLLGRESDGALICYYNNNVYKSLDSAASWTLAWAAGASVGPYMVTDGARIWYLARTSAVQFTDDLFATQAEFGIGDYAKSFLGDSGLVFMLYLNQGAGKFALDNTGYETTFAAARFGSAEDKPIAFGQSKFVLADYNGTPDPDEHTLYTSVDSGDTWAALPGTLYGRGGNFVYLEIP